MVENFAVKTKVGLVMNPSLIFPDKTILKEGEVGATIELIVSDTKTGKVSQRIGPIRSESFTKQFMQLLLVQVAQAPRHSTWATRPSIKDISNTDRSVIGSSHTFDCTAAIGDVGTGIVVGTGNTAPTITNYVMETLIAHGVGAGQLQYGAVTFGAPASDVTTSQFTITRNFANGSGGPITVNEIGLYCEARGVAQGVYWSFLTIRDVIGGGITVPDGQTLTVNYRPQAVI
jgi:hypothetical protein